MQDHETFLTKLEDEKKETGGSRHVVKSFLFLRGIESRISMQAANLGSSPSTEVALSTIRNNTTAGLDAASKSENSK